MCKTYTLDSQTGKKKKKELQKSFMTCRKLTKFLCFEVKYFIHACKNQYQETISNQLRKVHNPLKPDASLKIITHWLNEPSTMLQRIKLKQM